MNHKYLNATMHDEIVNLFTTVFTESENESKGETIGELASELAKSIDDINIFSFATYRNNSIISCVFFSRLFFKNEISVYMLSPMVVMTNQQGKGVGKSLINYALSEMKDKSVDVAVTYGDPDFYSKVGFLPLSEDVIQAPLKLSMPFGWLGLSLTQDAIPIIMDKPKCVKEFNKPSIW